MNARLIPSVIVEDRFAELLRDQRVPVSCVGKWMVPPVCNEFYVRWRWSDGVLHGLKLETLAMMARDAFVAEGGQLDAKPQPSRAFTKFGAHGA